LLILQFVLVYREDVISDLSVFHRIDDPSELSAERLLMLGPQARLLRRRDHRAVAERAGSRG